MSRSSREGQQRPLDALALAEQAPGEHGRAQAEGRPVVERIGAVVLGAMR